MCVRERKSYIPERERYLDSIQGIMVRKKDSGGKKEPYVCVNERAITRGTRKRHERERDRQNIQT